MDRKWFVRTWRCTAKDQARMQEKLIGSLHRNKRPRHKHERRSETKCSIYHLKTTTRSQKKEDEVWVLPKNSRRNLEPLGCNKGKSPGGRAREGHYSERNSNWKASRTRKKPEMHRRPKKRARGVGSLGKKKTRKKKERRTSRQWCGENSQPLMKKLQKRHGKRLSRKAHKNKPNCVGGKRKLADMRTHSPKRIRGLSGE